LPVKQTLQYGARNDAWVAWEEFMAELEFQQKHPEDVDSVELQKLLQKSSSSIDSYLKASGVR